MHLACGKALRELKGWEKANAGIYVRFFGLYVNVKVDEIELTIYQLKLLDFQAFVLIKKNFHIVF